MTHVEFALGTIRDGMTVGLGTGRAAEAFLRGLADQIRSGLRIRGVPTSERSARQARELGIPLASLDESDGRVDVCVDGADEFDPDLNLVKGLGGALLREKIVASAAETFLVLVGPDNLDLKRAKRRIGERGVVPIEIIPFGLPACRNRLAALCLGVELRHLGDQPFVTDNGNWILDARVSPLDDPAGFQAAVKAIPGIVETGLFLGMADAVLVQAGDSLDVLKKVERA